MYKTLLTLAVVLLTGTSAFGGFEPALDFQYNGVPCDGCWLAPSDIITVSFVDRGDTTTPGSFAQFVLRICDVDYVEDSFRYNLPPGILGGQLQIATGPGNCIAITGKVLYAPGTSKPPDGVIFSFDFHVPDDIQEGETIEVFVSGAYGQVDVSGLSTILPDGCFCLGDISHTSGLGLPDGRVDAGDMAALLTALILYGDPGDSYNITGAPNQSLLLRCMDVACSATCPPYENRVDTLDMAALLTHLILNGNPADNYASPCM